MRKYPTEMFGQGTINRGSSDFFGFAPFATTGTASTKGLEVGRMPTTTDATRQAVNNSDAIFPLLNGCKRDRQVTIRERDIQELTGACGSMIARLANNARGCHLLRWHTIAFDDKDKSLGRDRCASGLGL